MRGDLETWGIIITLSPHFPTSLLPYHPIYHSKFRSPIKKLRWALPTLPMVLLLIFNC